MREGDELRELSVLARDGGRPRCILRAVSSGLALVLSTFGFMGLGELCIFAMLLSGVTIQDGGIGVRSDVLFVVYVSWNQFPLQEISPMYSDKQVSSWRTSTYSPWIHQNRQRASCP